MQMIGYCESCGRMAALYVVEPDWTGDRCLVCRDCSTPEENEENIE
jgi:hypothetical protein